MNLATLERIPVAATQEAVTDADVAWILYSWPFPIDELELSKIEVDLEVLRQQQRDWDPDGSPLEDYL